jgi:hypothetical protein
LRAYMSSGWTSGPFVPHLDTDSAARAWRSGSAAPRTAAPDHSAAYGHAEQRCAPRYPGFCLHRFLPDYLVTVPVPTHAPGALTART